MTASDTLRAPRTAAGATAMGPPPRRRRWLRVVVVLLVLALLAGLGWLVAFSSVLAARQVSVTGAENLTPDQVRTAAQVPLGTPLARQDLGVIAGRVKALRLVSSVKVTRTWPRTISISVHEREPVVAIRQADGFLLIDATGRWFLTAPTVPAGVMMTDVDPTNEPLLAEIGQVARALPPKLERQVDRITAMSPDSIKLVLHDGDVAVWGDAEDSPLKAEVLIALLKQSASTYDVSAPHNPAIR